VEKFWEKFRILGGGGLKKVELPKSKKGSEYYHREGRGFSEKLCLLENNTGAQSESERGGKSGAHEKKQKEGTAKKKCFAEGVDGPQENSKIV